MGTDEDHEPEAGAARDGLRELFSEAAETEPSPEESSDDTADRAPGNGQGESTDGGTPSMGPDLDDAEILTDSTQQAESGHEGHSGEASAGPTATGASSEQSPATSSTDAEILTGDEPSGPEGPASGSAEATTTSTSPLPPTDTNRLTTGIRMLDGQLEGGIPPGRMLSLVAPPETQSELLVKEMAVSRPTVYISTFRPEWEIREELHDHLQKKDDDDLLDNELQVCYVAPEDLLADPMTYIGDMPKGANLIIDSINEFEVEDRQRYIAFLNTVKEVLWDTRSVGLFYGIEEDQEPPARSLTLKRSDVVFQLEHTVSANEIQTILVISKFRGGKALTEPVKLILTDEVQVDLSRDIG